MKLRHAVVFTTYVAVSLLVMMTASTRAMSQSSVRGYSLVEAQIPRYRLGRNTVVMVGGVLVTRGGPRESAKRELVSRRFAE
jgi:hypothetical protein